MTQDQADAVVALRHMFDGMETDPPLGWPAVHAFEAANNVVLPEPYRSFVATVTRGGKTCGPPVYGLWSPDSVERDWPNVAAIRLDQRFPLSEVWIWEDDEARADGVAVGDVYSRGIVPLGHDGCAMYWVLVVTGEHRGHVWNITDVGAQPFGREFGYTTGDSGFLGWVRHWYSGAEWWDAPTP